MALAVEGVHHIREHFASPQKQPGSRDKAKGEKGCGDATEALVANDGRHEQKNRKEGKGGKAVFGEKADAHPCAE